MTPTVKEVQAVFEGLEPSRGGYDSEFKFTQHDDCVEVNLLAEWKARYREPTVYVTAVNGDQVTYRYDEEPGDDVETESAEQVAEDLADTD